MSQGNIYEKDLDRELFVQRENIIDTYNVKVNKDINWNFQIIIENNIEEKIGSNFASGSVSEHKKKMFLKKTEENKQKLLYLVVDLSPNKKI